VTIGNEDIIKEFIQAKVVGGGEDYRDFVEQSDDLNDETVDTVGRLDKEMDGSDYVSVDEVESEINQAVNDLYRSGKKMRRGVQELESNINNQVMTDGGVEQEFERQFGSSNIVVDTIDKLKKLLKIVAGTVAFGGVAVSMILSAAGRSAVGAGILMMALSPVVVAGGLYAGDLFGAGAYIGVSAAAIIGGGLSWNGFDSVAKEIDRLYCEMRGIN
jgi:hypothetical protein